MKTTFYAVLFLFAFAGFATAQKPGSQLPPSDAFSGEMPDNVKKLPAGYVPETVLPDKTSGVEFSANCNVFQTLTCGQTYSNQTLNPAAGNDFTISDYDCISSPAAFSGYDRLYKITISQKTSVHFIMDILTPGIDLDIFLLTSCSPADCYAFSIEGNATISREVLDVNLNPDTYYLVIDGYNSAQQGSFNLTMNCSCTCIEQTDDLPVGHKVFCDGFEDYLPNKALSPQGTRWQLWDRCNDTNLGCNTSLSDDANVISDNGNQIVRLQQNGSVNPDLVYLLDNQTAGRWRLSWKMKVAAGKGAYYNMLHTTPNIDGGNPNWAFDAFFNANATGSIRVQGNTLSTFSFPSNQWFNVVHIIDLTKDSIQLWIDDQFVTQWKFSLGTLTGGTISNLKRIGGVNLYADTGTDFYVDDICFWSQISPCFTSFFSPVCIENGDQLNNEDVARCALYTSEEWEICNTVCNYGGTFIYRGDTYAGTLDASDKAPSLLRSASCVVNAYGGNVPGNLAADIYIFQRDPQDVSGTQMGVNFTNNGNDNTKCFIFVCSYEEATINKNSDASSAGACISDQFCWQFNTDIGSGVSDVFLNGCSEFYYLVVTGLPGATYSNLNVIPSGKCPSNPEAINCGDNKNGAVTGFQSDNYFSVIGNPVDGSAYTQCYSGTRTYNQGEYFYKFYVPQLSTVTITLNSTAQMGVFLYPFVCGSGCTAYAENTASNEQAVITETLATGYYYLIVDKNGGVSNNFSIALNCNQGNNFIRFYADAGEPPCPTNPAQNHQVAIPQTAFSFDNNDLIYFLYRTTGGDFTSSDSLNQYWPGAPVLFFNVQADDVLNDSVKCSYVPSDTFFVNVYQSEPGKRTYQPMKLTFAPVGPGITGGLTFSPGAISQIVQMKPEGQAVTFGATTGGVRVKSTVTQASFVFNASGGWILEETPEVPWLSVTPVNSDGAEEISLTLNPNPSVIPRSTILSFRSVSYPDLYRQFIKVEQLGICTTPNVSIDPFDPIALCNGQSATLSANTAGVPPELFTYKWSNGDTTASIQVSPLSTTVYTVTVTNADCFTTATSTKTVTVNQRPAAPSNPVNRTICQNGTLLPIGVTVPGGVTADWYTQPSGGTPFLSGATTYSAPATTQTYYAQARNTSSGCTSTTRTPVSVTVNPLPTIQIQDTVCAANNLTYSVTLTSNAGTTLTSSQGVISGGNGNFNISNVPADIDIQITATFTATGCAKTILLPAPSCGCPQVAAPGTSNSNIAICQGDNLPLLSVFVGAGQTADWYNAANTLLLAGSLTYTPTGAGTYFAKARDLTNQCVSTQSTAITLTINPKPSITASSTGCSPDLLTYSILLTTNADQVASSAGLVSGTGTVTISNIPVGTNPAVTATFAATGCSIQQTIPSPQCLCPTVSIPAGPALVPFCQGTPVPSVTVTVNTGETVDWYSVPSGGTPILTSAPTFAPAAPGTYYAQGRNTANGCVSASRSAHQLLEKPLPVLAVLKDTCEASLIFYRVEVTTDANLVTAAPYNVVNNGGGKFTVLGIPTGNAVTITALNTSTGCQNQLTVLKSECLCPTIDVPVSAGDKVICAGQNPLPVSVQLQPGETADWFDQPSGGNFLGEGADFIPLAAGSYFAQTRQLASGCTSGARTQVSLIENPAVAAFVGNDTIICAEGIVLLNGLFSNAPGMTWSASVPGGSFGNPNAPQTTYIPPTGVNSVVLTLQTADPSGPCPAASDQMVVNVNPLPNVQIVQTECVPSLTHYFVQFNASNVQVSVTPNVGQLLFLGNGQYRLEEIPKGTDVTLTLLSTLTGCERETLIVSPLCQCPPVAQPISLGDKQACANATTFPELKVADTPGVLTDWYGVPSGGTVLPGGAGVNAFTPPGFGPFYAQARVQTNSCTSSVRTPVQLTTLNLPLANAGPDQAICPGSSLTLSAASGPGYTYLWSNGSAGITVTLQPAVPPGYSVTVTDANSCTAVAAVQVSLLPVPTASIQEILSIACHGDSTGVLFAGAQGGSGGNYTYSWSNNQTTTHIFDVPAGPYQAVVTDGAGCRDTASYLLMEPPSLSLSNVTINPVPTPDAPTGVISVTVQGGTPPYTYAWFRANGIQVNGNQATLSDQLAGEYKVKVTDANGCVFWSDIFSILVVSTQSPDWSSYVWVFPNPNSGLVQVAFKLPVFADARLQVYDLLGNLVLTSTPGRIKDYVLPVDLHDLPDGMYLLRLDLDQSQMIVKTIVLNR